MIHIDKTEIKSCCGKSQTIWILSLPLSKELIPLLQQAGFSVLSMYTNVGMLHAEDRGLIANGTFGLAEIRIRCTNGKYCADSKELLEKVILAFA